MVPSPQASLHLVRRLRLRLGGVGQVQLRAMSAGAGGQLPYRLDIGTREVVGHGLQGEANYMDDVHAPFPAIRFKEDTAEIAMLREKEKGDWKKLTLVEKKQLYRASFCQTLVETEAPSGEWKSSVGIAFTILSVGLWIIYWFKSQVSYPIPITLTDDEHLLAQLKRQIDMKNNPVQGIASEFDYEKNEFKKK